MTCREASNLLSLFFDDELDAQQMRAVALHSTGCAACESKLRNMDRVQQVIRRTISGALEDINLDDLWSAVEREIGTVRVPWWSRVGAWREKGEQLWRRRLLALATAVGVAVLSMWLLFRARQSTTSADAPQVATLDDAGWIESADLLCADPRENDCH